MEKIKKRNAIVMNARTMSLALTIAAGLSAMLIFTSCSGHKNDGPPQTAEDELSPDFFRLGRPGFTFVDFTTLHSRYRLVRVHMMSRLGGDGVVAAQGFHSFNTDGRLLWRTFGAGTAEDLLGDFNFSIPRIFRIDRQERLNFAVEDRQPYGVDLRGTRLREMNGAQEVVIGIDENSFYQPLTGRLGYFRDEVAGAETVVESNDPSRNSLFISKFRTMADGREIALRLHYERIEWVNQPGKIRGRGGVYGREVTVIK